MDTKQLDRVVIRFAGDSGDGMQLTGSEFAKAADEAWQKAESFVARDVLNAAPTFGKQGDAVAPVKLALFDFELEDFSGGAGIIPESDQDREQLRLATETARRLLVESGRYSLVDVGGADAADVRAHTLRQCDGCDAAIARKLGADQSLVGIVTRVTRTERSIWRQMTSISIGPRTSRGLW